MNPEQQKHLWALLEAAVNMHRMTLIIDKTPYYHGHSSIPEAEGVDIPCGYCGIINQAEYDLAVISALNEGASI